MAARAYREVSPHSTRQCIASEETVINMPETDQQGALNPLHRKIDRIISARHKYWVPTNTNRQCALPELDLWVDRFTSSASS